MNLSNLIKKKQVHSEIRDILDRDYAVDDLTDVDTTGIVNGQVLIYSGDTFVPVHIGGVGNHVDLSTSQTINGIKTFSQYPRVRYTTYSDWYLPSRDELNLMYVELHANTYVDWYLPSKDELNKMYVNLHRGTNDDEGNAIYSPVGDFVNDSYWSSSEYDATTAWRLNFNSDNSAAIDKATSTYKVRAIRDFISETVYALRDTGPQGGLIFHYEDLGGGWFKYYESSLTDQSAGMAWITGGDTQTTLNGNTGIVIGTGRLNSYAIFNQTSHSASAADTCKGVTSGTRLSVGDFSTTDRYWSSSEYNDVYAIYGNFSTGSWGLRLKNATIDRVRAIRSFTDSIGVYSLRDIGPAGGYIFHIDGTTYYECNTEDYVDGATETFEWSNITDTLIGTTSQAIGTGAQNTLDIIGQVGHTDSAAQSCVDTEVDILVPPALDNELVDKRYIDIIGNKVEQMYTYTTVIEWDFCRNVINTGTGLVGAAVDFGTKLVINNEPNHPGIEAFRDSTAANGGYGYTTPITECIISGGERGLFVFRWMDVRSTSQARLGFQDTIVVTAPVDGIWLGITGVDATTATLEGHTRSNNTQSTTATSYTMARNTWYIGELLVNANASSVKFTLYNEAKAVLWTDTLTTNIPKELARVTGFGVLATESTTNAAADLIHIDYVKYDVARPFIG